MSKESQPGESNGEQILGVALDQLRDEGIAYLVMYIKPGSRYMRIDDNIVGKCTTTHKPLVQVFGESYGHIFRGELFM